jgi:hypothetical protein
VPTIGGNAGIIAQTPAGGPVDRMRTKRALIAGGIAALAIGALLIAFFPSFLPVVWATDARRRDVERLHAGDRRNLARRRRAQKLRSPPGPQPGLQFGG